MTAGISYIGGYKLAGKASVVEHHKRTKPTVIQVSITSLRAKRSNLWMGG